MWHVPTDKRTRNEAITRWQHAHVLPNQAFAHDGFNRSSLPLINEYSILRLQPIPTTTAWPCHRMN